MSPTKISIINLNSVYKLNEAFIKKIVSKILKILDKPETAALEIVFLNDAAIRALNKKYRKRNRATDVLSFVLDRKELRSKESLGEVFISLDTAFKNAKIFRTNCVNELALYIVHGILHLFGYEDEKTGDRLRMSRKESEILNRLCEREDLSKVLMPR